MVNNEEEMKDNNANISEKLKLLDEINEVKNKQDWGIYDSKSIKSYKPCIKR